MFGQLPETENLNEQKSSAKKKKKKLQPKTLRIKINKGKIIASMGEWKGSLKNSSHPLFIHSFVGFWGGGWF